MIDGKLTILIQGPKYPSTHELLFALRKLLPLSKIYYVHYKNEEKLNIDELNEILINDPGSDPEVGSGRRTNIIRMLSSTYGASEIKSCSNQYILKMRSDLIISNNYKFKKFIYKICQNFDYSSHLQLAVAMNGSLDPFSKFKYPYHFSDWMFIERLDRYKAKMNYFEKYGVDPSFIEHQIHLDDGRNLKNYFTKFQAEQINHFFDIFTEIGIKHGTDNNSDVLRQYVKYLASNVLIFRLGKVGIKSYKRPKGIGISHFFSSISPADIHILQKLNINQAIKYLRLMGKFKRVGFVCAQVIDKVFRKLGIIS